MFEKKQKFLIAKNLAPKSCASRQETLPLSSSSLDQNPATEPPKENPASQKRLERDAENTSPNNGKADHISETFL